MTTSAWPVVPLKAVLTDIQPGFASGEHNAEGNGIPHFRPMNVSTRGHIDRKVMKYVAADAGRPSIRLRRGDVVFNNTNSPELVGKTALFEDDDAPAFSNHMTRLRINISLAEPGYVALILNHAWSEGWFAAHCNNHVSQASIGRDVLSAFEIQLPPLATQRRLLQDYRSLDGHQASASGHLEASLRAIERFRQALLAAAFREADQNSHNESSAVPLERLLREPLKNGYSARPVNSETPFRILTLTATTSGHFDGRFFKYTDESFPEDSPFWLLPGDVLIQRGNTAEYVGVPAIYDGPPGKYLYPDLMIRARPRSDVNPRYLWYMLLAPQSRNLLRERATGSAGNMPKINQKVLNVVPVPLPTEDVRNDIVSRLDSALALAGAVTRRVQLGMKRVDHTSQAVLANVFHRGI